MSQTLLAGEIWWCWNDWKYHIGFDDPSVSQWGSAKISYFLRSISQNIFKLYYSNLVLSSRRITQLHVYNFGSVSQMGSELLGWEGRNWFEMVRVNSVQRVRPIQCSNLPCARCALWFQKTFFYSIYWLNINLWTFDTTFFFSEGTASPTWILFLLQISSHLKILFLLYIIVEYVQN